MRLLVAVRIFEMSIRLYHLYGLIFQNTAIAKVALTVCRTTVTEHLKLPSTM